VIGIRRARPDVVDFLHALVTHVEVEPFLGGRAAFDRDALLVEVERSEREPEAFGRFVIEVDGERAGALGFETANARSRIARLGRLAVDPGFRGRGVADEAARAFQRHLLLELGFHRLELEIYAFNERALRHAGRVGFVREGVRRKAYLRHGEWQDAVFYGLLREDLEACGGRRPAAPSRCAGRLRRTRVRAPGSAALADVGGVRELEEPAPVRVHDVGVALLGPPLTAEEDLRAVR
jgi:putative acetyltransferase